MRQAAGLNKTARSWVRWMAFLLWSTLLLPGVAWAGPTAAEPAQRNESAVRGEPVHGGDTPPSSALKLPNPPQEFSTYDGGWLKMAYHPSLAARVRVLQDQADAVRADLQK